MQKPFSFPFSSCSIFTKVYVFYSASIPTLTEPAPCLGAAVLYKLRSRPRAKRSFFTSNSPTNQHSSLAINSVRLNHINGAVVCHWRNCSRAFDIQIKGDN